MRSSVQGMCMLSLFGVGMDVENGRKRSENLRFIYFCHFGLAVRDGAEKNLEMAR